MSRGLSFVNHRWVQVLTAGILLFVATEQAFKLTGSPSFFPSVLLIGSFVVPVAFVSYMYERERSQDIETHRQSPIASVAVCFLVGGAIGVIVAGVLEFETLRSLDVLALLGVGLIEEAAKLILPIAIFLRRSFRSEMDGILFGVASGMGFASLETMGYGLVSFVTSAGDVNVLEQVLLVRGVLSPVGHAAWTGLVCGVLWRERARKGHAALDLAVAGAFVLAVAFHALWDLSNSLAGPAAGSIALASLGNLVVASMSLTLLIRRLQESERFSREPAI